MRAIDLVRFSLGLSDGLFNGLVNDLRDHPMATPTSAGGNHAIWTIGHLAWWEARIPGILDGSTNPLAEWESLFATGTQPTSDAKAYPRFDEVRGQYRQQRANLMSVVDQAGEAGLDRAPTNIPPGFEQLMATAGQTFLLMAMHQMLHAGELADIRRTLGFKPLA